MAADLPDLTGNWLGVMDHVGYDKNTAWLPNETVSYWPGGEVSLNITEQKRTIVFGDDDSKRKPSVCRNCAGRLER